MRLSSLTITIMLFVLLTLLLVFSFFALTPKIKDYRQLSQQEHTLQIKLQNLQVTYEKQYNRLRAMQSENRNITAQLQKSFSLHRVEKILQEDFEHLKVSLVERKNEGAYVTHLLAVEGLIKAPSTFYNFLEGLQSAKYALQVLDDMKFEGHEEGITTTFNLKVYIKETPLK